MMAPKALARTAGVLYLLEAGAAFNEGYVLPRVVKSGNATATAENIRSLSTLFRLGMVGDMMAATLWLLTAMALYLLLKDVHRMAAAAMVIFTAVGAGIQYLNQLNQYTALTIATSGAYARGPGHTSASGLTLLFAGLQHNGYLIDSLFFGLWLIPLGFLVRKSGYFPRVLGVLLIIGGCAYIASMFTQVLVPSAPGGFVAVYLTLGGVAELSLIVWLLIRGANVPVSVPAETAADMA